MTTHLTSPLTLDPTKRAEARRAVECLSMEVATALASFPSLTDEMTDDDERQRWRLLAAATADIALNSPEVERYLATPDQIALAGLTSTTDAVSANETWLPIPSWLATEISALHPMAIVWEMRTVGTTSGKRREIVGIVRQIDRPP